jgi:hypothetical protein
MKSYLKRFTQPPVEGGEKVQELLCGSLTKPTKAPSVSSVSAAAGELPEFRPANVLPFVGSVSYPDEAFSEVQPTAAVEDYCPTCSGPLTVESGEGWRHRWCPARTGCYDEWTSAPGHSWVEGLKHLDEE